MAKVMFTITKVTSAALGRWAVGFQAALVIAVLLASLAPSPGTAALYLPLTLAPQAQGIAWAKRHGSDLLGTGPVPGSIIVRNGTSDQFLSAASEGALLLSIPSLLCGASSRLETDNNRRDPKHA